MHLYLDIYDHIHTHIPHISMVTQVITIPFQEVLKPQLFLNWLVDSWFPQALIEADAAIILAGGRPVRIVNPDKASKPPLEQRLRIQWEDLKSDLTVTAVGYLEISFDTTTGPTPALVVKRYAKSALPGERQLMDKLLEGVNKNAYKKNFALPITTTSTTTAEVGGKGASKR